MPQPKISVVIPTYNRAHLLYEAIQSVLNQTFTDFELIIVDDGSTDNTEEVVRSIIDPRVNYLKQSNRGVSAARNTGLKVCTGEFVAFLDSDDLFLPERLSLQINRVTADPTIGLVYGLYYGTTDQGTTKKLSGTCYAELDLRRLLLGPVFHWSTVLIRRSSLEKSGDFDETLSVGEEWDLTLRLALSKCKMTGVSQPLAVVRMQPVSLSRDLHRYEASVKRVLDKTFKNPAMSTDLLEIKDTAYATQYVMIAASAYLTPHPEVGQNFLEQAITIDPTLVKENVDLLASTLVNFIKGLSLDDPEMTLRRMILYLPGEKTFSKKLERHVWEHFYLDAAFQAYQSGQARKCREYALKAITNAPRCLQNRGLLSILARSLVGNLSCTRKGYVYEENINKGDH